MVDIKEKNECCGCNACVQRCPESCITMREDNEGFSYPEVDREVCIDCGLCEKVCPVIHQGDKRKPLAVYAVKHKDDKIRLSSSSGGAFTALAESVIDEDGVVFWAKFDEDWSVFHDYTDTKEGLAAFRGSKYVQSRIGDSFKKAEYFLKAGRKVLFSGTPCQIAGLKRFLRKEYDNLLTVDFICHGVPSPGVWREYLKEETARQCGGKNSVLSHPNIKERDARIESISFRDKRLGWKKYSFALTLSVPIGHGVKNTVLLSEPLNKNIFLRGFLTNLYLRPSCHACPAKSFKSGSDITISDFWGGQSIIPEWNDDKGISVMFLHKEIKSVGNNSLFLKKLETYKQRSLFRSAKKTIRRKFYFSLRDSVSVKVRLLEKPVVLNRKLKVVIYQIAKSFGIVKIYKLMNQK
ncbi:Coenzyme F420 hydrogenase/dehydrogenase, beta subunit C-terminal domain [Parabacteroides distasonis]|uniref:4Fe-4S dicluster domain-containing protein n=1 Tax=Parabacteroides distasonis TaxID=823 RepID=A0A5C6KNV5_PARDI|nr:Coenzyme F420 hydrogenase/dehydrogenase, beta subunit C-terminal domain [Parabacteroides distasonis]TWV64533.1 4Fe-4S dicluster domain-containing protein [Parabacteroides distasonis]